MSFGCVFMLGSLWLWGIHSTSEVDTIDQYVEVEIEKSSSLKSLAIQLTEKNVISHPLLMVYYVKLFSDFSQAKSGKYRFQLGSSAKSIIEKIIDGEVIRELKLSVLISPGQNLKQIAQKLADLKLAPYNEIIELFYDQVYIQSFDIQALSLEGYLYPETYQYYDLIPELNEVIDRMVKQFFSEIPSNFYHFLSAKNISLHQAVIMASLIEKETSLDYERPMVAEVIWNRLNKKIPLGIDAALIYGIKDYQGDITFKHLKDKSNPYNNRIHLGLPPTPIANFSIESLKAVISHSSYGYLYYVLVPDGSKSHKFSLSLEEHNKHVRHLANSQKR